MRTTVLIIALVAFTSTAFAVKPVELRQPARSLMSTWGQRLADSWPATRAAIVKTGATFGVLAMLCSVQGCYRDKRVKSEYTYKANIDVGTHVLYHNPEADDGNRLRVGEVELVFQNINKHLIRYGESSFAGERQFVVENEEDGTHVVIGISSVVDFATHHPDDYAFLAWHWQDVFSPRGDVIGRQGVVEGRARKVFKDSGYYQVSPYSGSGSYLVHRRDLIVLKDGSHAYSPPFKERTVRVGWRTIKIATEKSWAGWAGIEHSSVSNYLSLKDQLSPDFYVGLDIHYRKGEQDYFGNVIGSTADGLRLEDGHSRDGTLMPLSQLQGVAIVNHPLYTEARFSDVKYLATQASANVGKSPLAPLPPQGDSKGYVRGKLMHAYTSGIAVVTAYTMAELRGNYYVVDSENLEGIAPNPVK